MAGITIFQSSVFRTRCTNGARIIGTHGTLLDVTRRACRTERTISGATFDVAHRIRHPQLETLGDPDRVQ